MTKKLFTRIISLFVVTSMLILCTTSKNPVYAATNNNGSNESTPLWWPGNPNPQPGTEDWFFQNPTYGGNAPDPVARECGKDAVFDALLPNSAAAFAKWYALRKFDLYTFGLSFAANVTYNYAICLWRAGVR